MQIIDSIYNMNDLLDLGISNIEKLELKRKKYPKIDCLYFVSPNEDVHYLYNSIILDYINRILEDFSDEL